MGYGLSHNFFTCRKKKKKYIYIYIVFLFLSIQIREQITIYSKIKFK